MPVQRKDGLGSEYPIVSFEADILKRDAVVEAFQVC